MSIIKEFKEFALKGNMVDLAIGVIIGASFNKVISSLVSDITMPILGLFTGGIDFSQQAFQLHLPGTLKPPVEVKYGSFINNIIDFLIIAVVIFIVIKAMNRLRSKPKKVEATEKKCPLCCMAIPVEAKKCGHCTADI